MDGIRVSHVVSLHQFRYGCSTQRGNYNDTDFYAGLLRWFIESDLKSPENDWAHRMISDWQYGIIWAEILLYLDVESL